MCVGTAFKAKASSLLCSQVSSVDSRGLVNVQFGECVDRECGVCGGSSAAEVKLALVGGQHIAAAAPILASDHAIANRTALQARLGLA